MAEGDDGSGAQRDTVETRQGVETYRVRYILLVSVCLAVIAMIVAGIVFTGR